MSDLRSYSINAVRAILGDYSLYRVYSYKPMLEEIENKAPESIQFGSFHSLDELKEAQNQSLRDLEFYGGEDSYSFGGWIDGKLAAATFFWGRARNCKHGEFWPLKIDEAWWVQLTTAEDFRARGLAGLLARYASNEMGRNGYHCLYGRVWHNHHASIRGCFERADWKYVALVAEFNPFGLGRTLRLEFKKTRKHQKSI